jgi:hypothetical protein
MLTAFIYSVTLGCYGTPTLATSKLRVFGLSNLHKGRARNQERPGGPNASSALHHSAPMQEDRKTVTYSALMVYIYTRKYVD